MRSASFSKCWLAWPRLGAQHPSVLEPTFAGLCYQPFLWRWCGFLPGRGQAGPQAGGDRSQFWVCAFSVGWPAPLSEFNRGEWRVVMTAAQPQLHQEISTGEGWNTCPPPQRSLSPSIPLPPTRSEPKQFRFHGSELSVIPRMLWSYLYFLPLPDLQWEIAKWIVSYVLFVPNVLSSIKDYPHLTEVLLHQVILLLMLLFSQSLWLFFIEIK